MKNLTSPLEQNQRLRYCIYSLWALVLFIFIDSLFQTQMMDFSIKASLFVRKLTLLRPLMNFLSSAFFYSFLFCKRPLTH